MGYLSVQHPNRLAWVRPGPCASWSCYLSSVHFSFLLCESEIINDTICILAIEYIYTS